MNGLFWFIFLHNLSFSLKTNIFLFFLSCIVPIAVGNTEGQNNYGDQNFLSFSSFSPDLAFISSPSSSAIFPFNLKNENLSSISPAPLTMNFRQNRRLFPAISESQKTSNFFSFSSVSPAHVRKLAAEILRGGKELKYEDVRKGEIKENEMKKREVNEKLYDNSKGGDQNIFSFNGKSINSTTGQISSGQNQLSAFESTFSSSFSSPVSSSFLPSSTSRNLRDTDNTSNSDDDDDNPDGIKSSDNDKKKKMFSTSKHSIIEDDSIGGRGHTLLPPEEHKYTVIFLHGLNDCSLGWMNLPNYFNKADFNKNTKYILPTGDSRSITIAFGMQCTSWFDLYGLTPESDEDYKGLHESVLRIHKIIDNELSINKNKYVTYRDENDGNNYEKKVLFSAKNIFIGGFSQGGACAIRSALLYKEQLGGLVVLSSWLPLSKYYALNSEEEKTKISNSDELPHAEQTKNIEINNTSYTLNKEQTFLSNALQKKNEEMQIFWGHGEKDNVVDAVWGKLSADFLKNKMQITNVTQKIYKNMGHTISEAEMKDIATFLQERMNDTRS